MRPSTEGVKGDSRKACTDSFIKYRKKKMSFHQTHKTREKGGRPQGNGEGQSGAGAHVTLLSYPMLSSWQSNGGRGLSRVFPVMNEKDRGRFIMLINVNVLLSILVKKGIV